MMHRRLLESALKRICRLKDILAVGPRTFKSGSRSARPSARGHTSWTGILARRPMRSKRASTTRSAKAATPALKLKRNALGKGAGRKSDEAKARQNDQEAPPGPKDEPPSMATVHANAGEERSLGTHLAERRTRGSSRC